MENPHMFFHGQGVTSTSARTVDGTDYEVVTGTSFAAPAAAGMIALIADRWPTSGASTEAVRALLMASAVHDVDTAVPGKTYSDYQDPDERDGAGVPNAVRVESMINGGRLWRNTLYEDFSFDVADRRVVYSNISLQAGQRLRAVLSWTVCPATSIPVGHNNGAHADLDLRLRDPSGAPVASGTSWDSGYEIFEYEVPSGGGGSGYSLEISHWGWDACPELSFFGYSYVKAAVAYDVR